MIPCQFQLLGQCSKGGSCKFNHDPSVCRPGGAGRPCRDFAKNGVCRNGDRCVYIHQSGAQTEQAYFYGQQPQANTSDLTGFFGDAPVEVGRSAAPNAKSSSATSWAKVARLPGQSDQLINLTGSSSLTSKEKAPSTAAMQGAVVPRQKQSLVKCKFFFSGGCKAGDACRFSHEGDETISSSGKNELTCGICFDDLRFKRVGVLTHCDHVFCLSCIREWRSSEMSEIERTKEYVQTCPVCRVRSFFVVPSDAPPSSPEEKKDLIDKFREACRKTPCRYKDSECPFGLSCMYYHEVIDPAKLGLRFAKTATGGDHAFNSRVATLGDFILK